MKPGVVLVRATLLSILFLTLHLASDFIHNVGELSLQGVFVSATFLVFVLYGALFLGERFAGQVIMLLGAIAALGMPILHLRNDRVVAGAIDRPGAYIFVWALIVLALTGLCSLILALRGLWVLRPGRGADNR